MQCVYQKSSYIVGEGETYYFYAEIARKLERVTRAIFIDETPDAEFDVEHNTSSILFAFILPFRIPKNELEGVA